MMFSPEIARMMKQVAVTQCTKRSNALKRTMVRPERPRSMRIMPRVRKKPTISSNMPRIEMAPIHRSVT